MVKGSEIALQKTVIRADSNDEYSYSCQSF